MKVVILAGGLGTRLAEETEIKPKPMVEIGEHPILWHIMKLYSCHGMKEFYLALGYKGDIIKQYFLDYHRLRGSMTVNLVNDSVEVKKSGCEDWVIHLVDTGKETNTGGRVKRFQSALSDGTFMVTYGDGVGDVNLRQLLEFHRSHGRIATVTAVRPPARFGELNFDDDNLITHFTEKPQVGQGWINGGFLVFEPEVFDYLQGDSCSLEASALERLAADRQLAAYPHGGFWQCMDTLRDKNLLKTLWEEGRAPWNVWD